MAVKKTQIIICNGVQKEQYVITEKLHVPMEEGFPSSMIPSSGQCNFNYTFSTI